MLQVLKSTLNSTETASAMTVNLSLVSSPSNRKQIVDKEVQGGQHGTGGQYMILFTCTNCDTKNTKKFNKNAYHHGVVLIRCDGCDKLHLIADNLGWFRDEKVNIEDLARETGQQFLKIEDNPELLAVLGQKVKLSTEEKPKQTDNEPSGDK